MNIDINSINYVQIDYLFLGFITIYRIVNLIFKWNFILTKYHYILKILVMNYYHLFN
jgi:hypothetical protein